VAALIAAQRDGHQVPHAVACRALGVSRSWFYKWRGGALPPQAQRRELLKAEVARLFRLHHGRYGSARITADLRDAGWRVSENTVAALMREQGLAARRKRRRKSTTRPGKGRWRAPDLVRRDFPATRVNCKWYGDGTEIRTGEGKLQLASILDMGSRRVLGFALSERHDAQLAYCALAMAVATTTPTGRTQRWACSARWATSRPSRPERRPDQCPAFSTAQDRPVLGPVKVVPPRAIRPCGGSTWTTPALRRLHGS
jgi:transposase InsO family protein